MGTKRKPKEPPPKTCAWCGFTSKPVLKYGEWQWEFFVRSDVKGLDRCDHCTSRCIKESDARIKQIDKMKLHDRDIGSASWERFLKLRGRL